MTTMNTAEIIDLKTPGSMPIGESLWSRIISRIGSTFGRMRNYLNQDMGTVSDSGDYFPMGDCCS